MEKNRYKHGHIGIGTVGQQGIDGISGNSFYIGNIDSFFVNITEEILHQYNLDHMSMLLGHDVLNPKYKVGDILYITDNDIICKAYELTEEHLLCTKEYLESSPCIKYPMSYLYQDIDNENILHFPLNMAMPVDTNDDISGIYNLQDKYKSSLVKGTILSNDLDISFDNDDTLDSSIYNSYIPDRYDPNMTFDNIVNNGNVYTEYYAKSDVSLSLLKCDTPLSYLHIDTTPTHINFTTDSSFIKVDNLYIKKYNKGNIEALDALYDPNLFLDTNGNCYTLNSGDVNHVTLQLQLNKSKFFKRIPDNIDEYKMGYIHTMYNYSIDVSSNKMYKPNYIHDVSVITKTFRDISIDQGVYVRNWSLIDLIDNKEIKDLLKNTLDIYKLNNVSNLLSGEVNANTMNIYKDTSGIIVTHEVTKDVVYDVIKTPDFKYAYYQTDIQTLDNFLVIDGSCNDIKTKGFVDSSVLEIFDPNYNSSIIYESNIEDIDINLKQYDPNIIPYINHNIITWILTPNGFKHYSNNTNVVYDITSNTYNVFVNEQLPIDTLITIHDNTDTSTFFDYNITSNDNTKNLYINPVDGYDIKSVYINDILSPKISETLYSIDNYTTDVSKYVLNKDILQQLYSGETVDNVNTYEIPVMVKYCKTDDPENVLYDSYTIKSSGYIEYRTLPKIDLHIYDDMESLEKFNNVNKGILCNQFITFMKVSISDFDNSNWGKLYKEAKLSFSIQYNNIADITNEDVPICQCGLLKMPTASETYYKISKDTDIYNITLSDIVKSPLFLMDNIINVSLTDDKEFYIAILIEQDNPLPSIYHLAYLINGMSVTFKNNDFNNITSRLNNDITVSQSNHLYATVIPISMTAKYTNESRTLTKTENIKMFGSDKSIDVAVYPYEIDKVYESPHVSQLWNSYQLKNRYFQDNIKSLNIIPINVNDFYETLPDNMYDDYWIERDNDDVTYSYLSVAYDVDYTLLEDEEIFIYNNKQYLASKYSQVKNKTAVFVLQIINKPIRTDEHIESLLTWNKEYTNLYHKESDSPFTGHTGVHGNGYLFMKPEYDKNQYMEKSIMPLSDLLTIMNQNIFDNVYTTYVNTTLSDNYTPDIFFDSFVKLVKWTYPKYITESGITSINQINMSNGVITNTTYDDKLHMPYNLCYSIYPRVLYNDEAKMHIILMLRQPTVSKEESYKYGLDPLPNILNYFG